MLDRILYETNSGNKWETSKGLKRIAKGNGKFRRRLHLRDPRKGKKRQQEKKKNRG